MPKLLKISVLALSAVLLLTVFLGANLRGVHAATDTDGGAYRQMRIYGDVLRHIQTDYVEDPNMSLVTANAVRGLVETLDSSSSYMTPEEYRAYKAHTDEPGQVGMTVAKRGFYAVIVSVVPGGPADKADLQSSDAVEVIDGKNTHDLSIATINAMLSGKPGTQVALSVINPRKNRPEKLQLTRSVIAPAATTEIFYEGNTILYLKPGMIDRDHIAQVEQRLKAMSRMGSKKVLLDLRDTSSGSEADGLRLANLFIKNGTLATLEGQKVPQQTFSAESGKSVNANAPMVTLVNRGTAGAAELAAGALMDSKRSDVVGEKTFGEGSELKIFELPDGGAVLLAVAKYHTPSGKKLQDEGLTPAILVASDDGDGAAAGADDQDEDSTGTPQSNPNATVNSSKPALPQAKQRTIIDEQLNKGLDILKGKAA